MRATDGGGNTDGTEATRTWTIDTAAPQTTIDAAPSDPSNATAPSFTLSASESGSTFECRLDGSAYAPCASPKSYSGLGDGSHTFDARAVDAAGNVDATAASHTWTIDTTAPSGALTAPADGAVVADDVEVSADASDAGSDVANVAFEVKPSGDSSFSVVATDSTSPYAATWTSTSAPDGPAELRVVVTDGAGNAFTSAIRTVTVDNEAPVVTLDPLASSVRGAIALTATSSADTAVVTFEQRRSGDTAWNMIADDMVAPFDTNVDTTSLTDGVHEFRAVAVDEGGNATASTVRSTRVDNTAPATAVTAPGAGATVGGPDVAFTASASDDGTGVASVAFQYRLAGDPGFTDVGTDADGSDDWSASWDAGSLPSGDYELRTVATDAVGNAKTSALVTVTVDSAAPAVTLDDPGTSINGIVTLTATAAGDTVAVVFEYRADGAGSWTSIATDDASPWSATLDTRTLAEGLYDLRAIATDAFANTAIDVRSGIRVDVTAPRVSSSTPSDGATVAGATEIEVIASETIAQVVDATLDGAPTAAPTIAGSTLTFATGPLASGPHTLGGELEDESGMRTPFRVHFTVWDGPTADYPYVEKNTSASIATTLAATNGVFAATMPSAAWTASGGDWLVLRIDPGPGPDDGDGLEATGDVVDVTARWALAGTEETSFSAALDVLLGPAAADVLPAKRDGSSWRPLREVPSGATLPSGWSDGFYRDADGAHVLSTEPGAFTLLRDTARPTEPKRFRGSLADGTLKLQWEAASDNSGVGRDYIVYADGAEIATAPWSTTSTTLSPTSRRDARSFTVAARDVAGNVSGPTFALRIVPNVRGRTIIEAKDALEGRGFSLGDIVKESSEVVPAGLAIRAAAGTVLPDGVEVPLVISTGPDDVVAPRDLVLKIGDAEAVLESKHDVIFVNLLVSEAARVTATLFDSSGRKIFTWRDSLAAGATDVRMAIPRGALASGTYEMVVTAVGPDGDTTTQRVRITVPSRSDGGSTPISNPLYGNDVSSDTRTGDNSSGFGGGASGSDRPDTTFPRDEANGNGPADAVTRDAAPKHEAAPSPTRAAPSPTRAAPATIDAAPASASTDDTANRTPMRTQAGLLLLFLAMAT
ncbi:MAG: PASTA domain-containing protein, partial [Actinobacteria bacterium]|nr:PASTA domain-containing protein [Actinomycetota bacterium]